MFNFIKYGFLSIRNPKTSLHNVKYYIKLKYQRLKRGYADQDAYNIYSWFLHIFPDMLRTMQDDLHGSPLSIDFEEWKHILSEMETCFRNANIDNLNLSDFKNMEEVSEYIENNLDKGFELFRKWFFDMWD